MNSTKRSHPQPSILRSNLPPASPFPPAWAWFLDEVVPQWVKEHYSPKDSWKKKPFSLQDARFFSQGVEELSELFTEERPQGMPPYFQHPKYRSSYLLYFLPLQMAKFLTLFQQNENALAAALDHGMKTGHLRIADLGAGPGTASLAFLLWLLQNQWYPEKELPLIELYWSDINKDILKDGQALVDQIANSFPKTRGKISIQIEVVPWWKASSYLPHSLSLIFLGHILNESHKPRRESELNWSNLLKRADGGGVLMVEPATRKSSQTLSSLRDQFLESSWIENSSSSFWGPCLHSGACPLSQGRDWCHFSYPAQIPGQWFKFFSEALGSERHWVKLSYLWLSSSHYPAPQASPSLRRVISDPLSQGTQRSVLICEPNAPGRLSLHPKSHLSRGDCVQVHKTVSI